MEAVADKNIAKVVYDFWNTAPARVWAVLSTSTFIEV